MFTEYDDERLRKSTASFIKKIFVDQRQRIYRHYASDFYFFGERYLTPQLQSFKTIAILSIDVITFL